MATISQALNLSKKHEALKAAVLEIYMMLLRSHKGVTPEVTSDQILSAAIAAERAHAELDEAITAIGRDAHMAIETNRLTMF